VTRRRGRRRRKLRDDLKERRWYSHLKEEALDRTMWRARLGRGFGPVVRQTAKWMIMIYCNICGSTPPEQHLPSNFYCRHLVFSLKPLINSWDKWQHRRNGH
jgi:hypothetical protein